MPRSFLAIASILLALAVSAGAFGAHGLKDRIDPYLMTVFEKAVFYHFIHAIGIMIVSLLAVTGMISESSLFRIGSLLVGGIFVFSGSLYLLAITGARWLGAITPIGGISFIAAWVFLALALLRK